MSNDHERRQKKSFDPERVLDLKYGLTRHESD
jgi:hypothetical protein